MKYNLCKAYVVRYALEAAKVLEKKVLPFPEKIETKKSRENVTFLRLQRPSISPEDRFDWKPTQIRQKRKLSKKRNTHR